MTDDEGEEEPYKWWAASLRIMSDVMSVEQISKRVGIAHPLGQMSRPRLDETGRDIRRDRVWLLESEMTSDHPLDEQLEALLARIEPHAAAVRALRAEGCGVEFFTGFASSNGQGGVTLTPRLLERIGELGADLSLDLYPPP